jgi:hypothetical protein
MDCSAHSAGVVAVGNFTRNTACIPILENPTPKTYIFHEELDALMLTYRT